MLHPLTKVLRVTGLSLREIAMIADLNESSLRHVDQGRARIIGPKLLRALEQLGFDSGELAQEYIVWRRSKAEAALQKACAS